MAREIIGIGSEIVSIEIFLIILCIMIAIANISNIHVGKSTYTRKPKNISSKLFNALVSSCVFFAAYNLIIYLIYTFSETSFNIISFFSFTVGLVLTILFMRYVRAIIKNKNKKFSRDLNCISILSVFIIILNILIPIIQLIISRIFNVNAFSQDDVKYSNILPLITFIIIISERVTLSQKLEIERSTFRDAIMKNASMYVVIDVTEGMITEDIIDESGNSVLKTLGFSVPAPFDEEAKAFLKNNKVTFLSGDAEKYFSCAGLNEMYKEGINIDSIEICLDAHGEETYLRMMPIFSIDPYTKHLICVCPYIDITVQKKKKLELQNKVNRSV